MPEANPQLKIYMNVDKILTDLRALSGLDPSNSSAWRTLRFLRHDHFNNNDLEKIIRFLTLENELPYWDLGSVIYRCFEKLGERSYVDYDDLLQWVLINKGGNIFLESHRSLSADFVRRLIALGFDLNNKNGAENLKTSGWHSKVWEVNDDRGRDQERIPKLFYRRLVSSALVDDELLLEALLLRGFLALRDEVGVWLGTGSHADDLIVLKWVHGLSILPARGSSERLASIRFNTSNRDKQLSSVAGILSIPTNTTFMSERAYPYQLRVGTWDQYRATVWGTKLSVCPSTFLRGRWLGYDALDAGIALLVKAWPLARVSTAFGSCDGHGRSAPIIGLGTEWDRRWAKAVFKSLAVPTPYSVWFEQGHSNQIRSINNLYDNASLLGLMDDIQRFARRLLDMTVIEKIGSARLATLAKFGPEEPHIEDFFAEAASQLLKKAF
jgi:hypothetical protein